MKSVMWLVRGLSLPRGVDLSQGGMCRRRRAGAEHVGAGPQPEAQSSWWPLPQPLHLCSDMALRRKGDQARKGGADLSKKVGQGSPGSMEARLGAVEEVPDRPFPRRSPGMVVECLGS